MKERFNIKAEDPNGEAFNVVFNATSLQVAIEALLYIAENAASFLQQIEEGLDDEPDEK